MVLANLSCESKEETEIKADKITEKNLILKRIRMFIAFIFYFMYTCLSVNKERSR